MTPVSRLVLATVGRTPSTIIEATGVLDIATVSDFETAVDAELARDHLVIVDLAGLTLCDSAGLGAMVRLRRRALAVGATFAVRAPRESVTRVLAISGIDRVVPVLAAGESGRAG